MKKKLALVLGALFVFGCSPGASIDKEEKEPAPTAVEVQEKEKEETQEDANGMSSERAIEVFSQILDNFVPDFRIQEPDSIGTIYVNATVVNDTPYPVLSYQYTFKDLTTNEKHYLSTYDTVLPGETTPEFSTFSPENFEDIDTLEISATVKTGDNEYYMFMYDVKLDNLQWYETTP